MALLASWHYNDVIIRTMASQITGVSIVYSTVGSGINRKKHQSSASLAFVRGIHRWPVNSPHKRPVTRKMFPFDDVIVDRPPGSPTLHDPSHPPQLLVTASGPISCCPGRHTLMYLSNKLFSSSSFKFKTVRFVGPTWGPSGADRTQVGPMLAPWSLLSGYRYDVLSSG